MIERDLLTKAAAFRAWIENDPPHVDTPTLERLKQARAIEQGVRAGKVVVFPRPK